MVYFMTILHRALAAGVLAVVCVVAAPSQAAMADTDAPVEFVSPSLTVEYGEYWHFDVAASRDFLYYLYRSGNYTLSSTGTPSGYQAGIYLNSAYSGTGGDGEPSGSIYPNYDSAPLSAGTYTFSLSGSTTIGSGPISGHTPTPARLTVSKAALGIDLRVLGDSNNPKGAVVNAAFSGRYVDEYTSSTFDYAAISPAGVWKITLKDDEGAIVTERSFERTAGDDNLAVSFYWPDAEPNRQYTANATFTPSGSSAANFSVTPATEFSYTAPGTGRPTPASTAPAEAPGVLPEPAEFALPLWALILAGVLAAGLGALVTVFGIRLRKPPVVGHPAVTL